MFAQPVAARAPARATIRAAAQAGGGLGGFGEGHVSSFFRVERGEASELACRLNARGTRGDDKPSSGWNLIELHGGQFGVKTISVHQLGMGADIDDGARFQRDDAIGIDHRTEAVGNDQGGPGLHRLLERQLDSPLAFSIKRTGGFVKQQERCVFKMARAMLMR